MALYGTEYFTTRLESMRWGDVLLLLRLLKTWVCAGLLVCCMHIRMCSALGCTGGGACEVSCDQSRSQCHRYCRCVEPCPSTAASCQGWLRWRGWPQCWSAVRCPCQTEHGPSGSCDEGCCGPSQWRDRKPPGSSVVGRSLPFRQRQLPSWQLPAVASSVWQKLAE